MNSKTLLKVADAACSDREKEAVLSGREIIKLKARLSKMAAESGTATKGLMAKLKATDEARKTDVMRRNIEVAVLRGAIEAVEKCHSKEILNTPDFGKQRLAFEEDRLHEMRRMVEEERLDIQRYRSALQDNHYAREKKFEEERLRVLHQSNQELIAGRANVDVYRTMNDEANRREKERLICLQSVLDSERTSIARDRSVLDAERSQLEVERTEFRSMCATLEPRFRDADAIESRATLREKAATKAEDDVRAAAAEMRLTKVDLDKREAAVSEASLAAIKATQRAEQVIKFACSQLVQSKQNAIVVEHSKFVISRQRVALARQIVDARRAVSYIKHSRGSPGLNCAHSNLGFRAHAHANSKGGSEELAG